MPDTNTKTFKYIQVNEDIISYYLYNLIKYIFEPWIIPPQFSFLIVITLDHLLQNCFNFSPNISDRSLKYEYFNMDELSKFFPVWQ